MHPITRRQLLQAAGAGAAALAFAHLSPLQMFAAADDGGFKLPDLPYPKDALEPHIDALTMEIHHDRHHKAYVDNLNKAIAGNAALEAKSLEQIVKDLSVVPDAIRGPVR